MKRRLAVLSTSVAALGLLATPASAAVRDAEPPCVNDAFTQLSVCAPDRPVPKIAATIAAYEAMIFGIVAALP